MSIKVGINGFGRIGRFVFRAAVKRNDIEIVAINDLAPVDYLAYMLKYDTMHGRFDGTIEADVENSTLIVNGKKIRVTAEVRSFQGRDPDVRSRRKRKDLCTGHEVRIQRFLHDQLLGPYRQSIA